MTLGIENNLRSGIYEGNLEEVQKNISCYSELYSTVVAQFIGLNGEITSLIINYLAPCHALLSKKGIYSLNKNFFESRELDFFAFSIKVLFHFHDNKENRIKISKLLLRCHAPFVQGVSYVKEHSSELLSDLKDIFETELSAQEAIIYTYKHEIQLQCIKKKEANRGLGKLTELYEYERDVEKRSQINLNSLQEYFSCLELIHEELSQVPVELMWLEEIRQRWENTDKQKRHRKGVPEKLFIPQEMEELQARCKILHRQIDVQEKALKAFYYSFAYFGKVGSAAVLMCVNSCLARDSNHADQFAQDVRFKYAEYVLRLLESFEETHLAMERKTTYNCIILKNLQEIAEKLPILRSILHIENVDERVDQVIKKIQSYSRLKILHLD